MKFDFSILVLGVIGIFLTSLHVVPLRANGLGIPALVIAALIIGTGMTLVSGIIAGWINRKWRGVGFAVGAMAFITLLLVGFV